MRLLRALLVERRFPKRLYLQALLAAAGFDCVNAPDAEAALAYSGANGIDLIVVDGGPATGTAPTLVVALSHGAFGINPPPLIIYASEPINDPALLATPNCAIIQRPLRPTAFFEALSKAFGERD